MNSETVWVGRRDMPMRIDIPISAEAEGFIESAAILAEPYNTQIAELVEQRDRARAIAVQLEQQIAAALAIHIPVITGSGLGDGFLYSCDVCLTDSGEEPDWGHDPHEMAAWPCATARALGVVQ